jgi:FtsH-binding integral membrane protein
MEPDRSIAYRGSLAQPQAGTDARAVFGQTMALVAVTVGFFALGAYIGRDLGGGNGLLLFIAAFVPLIGLNFAVRRGAQSLAIALLFAFGLLFGVALGPVLNEYVQADPSAVYQAGGSTALFVAGFGAYGYATRRDLSSWGRTLFWALLALIAFGLITLFVAIPGANIIYCVLGLGIFGALTMFDFNRLRNSGMEAAPLLAASIFLDVINVFLFFLQLFGGGGSRN